MELLSANLPTPLVPIVNEITKSAQISLYLKRDDLIHPLVSGNKWRKLKYSLLEAQHVGARSLLTFGGAYSNHLYALAAAGRALDLPTIGIVRGEELANLPFSSTLQFCKENGMQLVFVTRSEYKNKSDKNYLKFLSEAYNGPFIIPEGGTSLLAVKGVSEIVDELQAQLSQSVDYYAVAAGTGGTAAGILSRNQNVLSFSVLKGGAFLKSEILNLVDSTIKNDHLQLFTKYHFGGYGKWTPELLEFICDFKKDFDIQLEQVYTAKMLYGLFDLIITGYFKPQQTIVAIHTGGLQGLLKELT